MSYSSSLLISTYNRPDFLELCLKSVLQQKKLPDEVIIADDGSCSCTRKLIDSFRAQFPIPIKHVWHEDKGFRLAKIRNRAIAAAINDYIIQIDCDIILHPFFIKDHLDFARESCFTRASRVYINEEASKRLINAKSTDISVFRNGVSNFFSGIRIPYLWRFFDYSYKSKGAELYEIHGCNMAYWKKDAEAVNGYNEEFEGWGPEDKEFVARLLNLGLKKRFLKFGGIGYHFYHLESNKSMLSDNIQEFKKTISLNRTFCKVGINQYITFK
jgi:glycosyltransferase involved in cell wall biosynthesis